jgi:chitin disaccharide deacetylase
MKRIIFLPLILLVFFQCRAQNDKDIYLIIRGDDIGSSHSSNIACIQSYQSGIMRSTEIMVPCPWFPEAVKLLKQNRGLDVGIHLVLTSEWNDYKWRPLTHCPSLVDQDGYFYPMIWQREDFPKGTALHDAAWKIEEIEQELRAQIEMAKRYIPWVSHADCHMGCTSCSPQIDDLVKKLVKEYNLNIDTEDYGVRFTALWEKNDTTSDLRIKKAIDMLRQLKPGKYLFIEHPGLDTPEMRAIWHTGYFNVAADRDAVTRVFTSTEVMDVIKQRGIKLISYADLKNQNLK